MVILVAIMCVGCTSPDSKDNSLVMDKNGKGTFSTKFGFDKSYFEQSKYGMKKSMTEYVDNTKKEETTQKDITTQTKTTDNNFDESPKTGDNLPIEMLLMVMAMTAVVIYGCIVYNKRNR